MYRKNCPPSKRVEYPAYYRFLLFLGFWSRWRRVAHRVILMSILATLLYPGMWFAVMFISGMHPSAAIHSTFDWWGFRIVMSFVVWVVFLLFGSVWGINELGARWHKHRMRAINCARAFVHDPTRDKTHVTAKVRDVLNKIN